MYNVTLNISLCGVEVHPTCLHAPHLIAFATRRQSDAVGRGGLGRTSCTKAHMHRYTLTVVCEWPLCQWHKYQPEHNNARRDTMGQKSSFSFAKDIMSCFNSLITTFYFEYVICRAKPIVACRRQNIKKCGWYNRLYILLSLTLLVFLCAVEETQLLQFSIISPHCVNRTMPDWRQIPF